MPSSERVRVEVSEHVATVTLARPEKHNALDQAMFAAIVEAAEEVAATAGVRAVVLHGEGPSFCSGIDVSSAFSGDAGLNGGLDGTLMNVPNPFQRTAYDWITLPVPVIAAVHGNCLGGGFQIALGADMRYATADTRFSVMEIKWGLVPDLAGTQLMRHLAREDVVRELTYTGRIFNGTEAQQLGFVTRVVDDPRAAALETAKEIAGKSPDAVRAAKRILNDAVAVDAATGLMAESVEQQKLISSPNQLEAIMSNLQKRAANFKD